MRISQEHLQIVNKLFRKLKYINKRNQGDKMAEKFEEIAVVVDQSSLGNGIYDITLKTDKIARQQRRDSLYRFTQTTRVSCFRVR